MLVNSSDSGGGAERIAMATLEHLLQEGHQAWLAVGSKSTNHPRVLELQNDAARSSWARFCSRVAGPRSTSVPLSSISTRLRNWIRNRLGQPLRMTRIALGQEDFSFPATQSLLAMVSQEIDLVHCHNLHGNYFDLRFLIELSNFLPVMITLHDAWLLSGHCAHSLECERWKTGCGSCPNLSIYPSVPRDATAYNWKRKGRIFSACQLFVNTPAFWLMERVKQSMLAPAIQEARVIPNGVNLSVFYPGDQIIARKQLGLPTDAKIIMVAANGIRGNPFKDFNTLRTALTKIGSRPNHPRTLCIAIGDNAPVEWCGNLEIRFVPYQAHDFKVAEYYRASDIYVHAARVDTFPTTVLEASACGIPIVASAVGGVVEQIESGQSGFLVPPYDADSLAGRISLLLEDSDLRKLMGLNGNQRARDRFDSRRMLRDQQSWYEEIINRSTSRHHGG